MFRYTRLTFAREFVLLVGALIFCVPIYLLLSVSLKSDQASIASPFGLPTHPVGTNFSTAWTNGTYPGFVHSMLNSLMITVGTVAVLILFGSLGAYVLARRKTKLTTGLYFAFVLGYILPLQLAIIPLFSAMHRAGLTGTVYGAILLYSGLLMPLAVFLYTGFVRTVPHAYEESAQLDGAGPLRAFAYVVFPLLRPVTATVAILAGVTVWNDFFVSLIFLSGSSASTLPAMLYGTVGDYTSQYNLTFASVLLAVAPIILFFLLAQRQLVKGFAGGLR